MNADGSCRRKDAGMPALRRHDHRFHVRSHRRVAETMQVGNRSVQARCPVVSRRSRIQTTRHGILATLAQFGEIRHLLPRNVLCAKPVNTNQHDMIHVLLKRRTRHAPAFRRRCGDTHQRHTSDRNRKSQWRGNQAPSLQDNFLKIHATILSCVKTECRYYTRPRAELSTM